MKMTAPFFLTAKKFASLDSIPKEYTPAAELIFSSPATVSYNSPGALGYGVKRAALSIPESAMLLVAPDCCGRNSTILSVSENYSERFFYLRINEKDLVSGGHLDKIENAVSDIFSILTPEPKAVLICTTCTDALLGSDIESICCKLEENYNAHFLPVYMYALDREGRKPPMTLVHHTVWSLIKKQPVNPSTINILGFFPELDRCSELFDLLKKAGVKKINQLASFKNFSEYEKAGEANFNLVINPEAAYAAAEIQKKLGIPFIQIFQTYDVVKIKKQYQLLAQAAGIKIDADTGYEKTGKIISSFKEKYGKINIAVGQMLNGNSFDIALSLLRYGFNVPYIFSCPTENDFVLLKKIAGLSPETKIFSNTSASMINFSESAFAESDIDISIGKDTEYYFEKAVFIPWNDENQPFGFHAVEKLFSAMESALEKKYSPEKNYVQEKLFSKKIFQGTEKSESVMNYISPAATDQSGAASVFYELGGMTVICDAGGCAGNISGFDEPRFTKKSSAVFSAALRNMDAIMGDDGHLINKITDACRYIEPEFISLVSTPVPAITGTDFRALKKLIEKKTDRPVFICNTKGIAPYDYGESEAFIELIKHYADKKNPCAPALNYAGILGTTPLNMAAGDSHNLISERIKEYGNFEKAVTLSMDYRIEYFKMIPSMKKNFVVSPSGIKPAEYIKETFGIDYEIIYPLDEKNILPEQINSEIEEKKILIMHQQVLAESIAKLIRTKCRCNVQTGTFFMKNQSVGTTYFFQDEKDFIMNVRNENYDVIIADPLLKKAVPDFKGKFIPLPHYAFSGQLEAKEKEQDFFEPLKLFIKEALMENPQK